MTDRHGASGRNAAGQAVTALAAAIVLASVLFMIFGTPRLGGGAPLVAAVFFVTMYVGELLRLGGLDARGLSPIAVAGAVGFALVCERPHGVALSYGAPLVVVVSVAALLLGVVTQRRVLHYGGEIAVPSYAIRVIVIALVALLFRQVSIAGEPLMTRGQDWTDQRWWMALAMVAVTVVAHGVEVLLQVTLRSFQDDRSWLTVLREDLLEMVPASLSALSAAIVIALAVRSLDLFAVPIFLVPLVLMRYAIQRQHRTGAARRESMVAISRLTDLAGYTRTHHAQRVAALCQAVGSRLQLTDRELADLQTAALLHDVGQVMLEAPIPGGATVEAAPRDQQRIADSGADIVRRTGAAEAVVEIVEQQAIPYRRMLEAGEQLRLPARILKACNAYDDFCLGKADQREVALMRLRLGLGYEYDPRVVEQLALVTSGIDLEEFDAEPTPYGRDDRDGAKPGSPATRQA